MNTLATSTVLPPAGAWRIAGLASITALAVLFVLYRDTFGAMVEIWMGSEAFAHGFLVAPLSIWLAWRERERLRPLNPHPAPWLALPLAGAAFLWVLGDLAGVNAVAQLAVVAMLVIVLPMLLGTSIGREFAFPLGFLFFMVPLGDFMVPQMMTWTADVTVGALRMFGVPVYREGLQFVVPSGSWSVIEACSGVRYLVVSVLVGVLFAYLNYSSITKRMIFIASAVVVALVANWLRAILLVMVGHLSDNRLGTGDDHFFYGWLVYGVVIFLIFWIGGRWSDRLPLPSGKSSAEQVAGMQAAASAPASAWTAALAAAIIVIAVPVGAQAWFQGGTAAPVVVRMPPLGSEPQAVPPLFPAPEYSGPAAQAWASYDTTAGPVAVHVAYYRQQQYGRKLVSSQNALVKSSNHDWALVSQGEARLEAGGREIPLRTADLRGGQLASGAAPLRVQVRQVYWVDGTLLADDRRAVLHGLWGRLAGRGDDAAVITFYSNTSAGGPEAAALEKFVSRHLPALVGTLEGVRGTR